MPVEGVKMNKLLIILLLTACSEKRDIGPKPFESTDEEFVMYGCEKLKKDVQEWNRANPTLPKKKADC